MSRRLSSRRWPAIITISDTQAQIIQILAICRSNSWTVCMIHSAYPDCVYPDWYSCHALATEASKGNCGGQCSNIAANRFYSLDATDGATPSIGSIDGGHIISLSIWLIIIDTQRSRLGWLNSGCSTTTRPSRSALASKTVALCAGPPRTKRSQTAVCASKRNTFE